MAATSETASGFWGRLLDLVARVIQVTELMAESADSPAKKEQALDLIESWHRQSGISIRYLPGPIERYVIRRIASGLLDGLAELMERQERFASDYQVESIDVGNPTRKKKRAND